MIGGFSIGLLDRLARLLGCTAFVDLRPGVGEVEIEIDLVSLPMEMSRELKVVLQTI